MKPLNSDRCGDFRTLLPLLLLLASLPVLTHWLKAQLPSFLDPKPGGSCPIGSGKSGCPDGKCPLPPEFEELASNTNLFKVGYIEFDNPPTLPAREKASYYLNRKQQMTATYDTEDYNAWHGVGWFCFGYYGNEAENHVSYSHTRTDDTARITGTVTTSFAGSWAWPGYLNHIGFWQDCGNGQEPFDTSFSSWNFAGSITNTTTGEWNEVSQVDWLFPVWDGVTTISRTVTSTDGVAGVTNNNGYPPDPNAFEPEYNYWRWDYASMDRITLTNEYTTSMLLADTVTILPAYPTAATNWGRGTFRACLKNHDA